MPYQHNIQCSAYTHQHQQQRTGTANPAAHIKSQTISQYTYNQTHGKPNSNPHKTHCITKPSANQQRRKKNNSMSNTTQQHSNNTSAAQTNTTQHQLKRTATANHDNITTATQHQLFII